MEGSTVILILCGAGVLGLAGYWVRTAGRCGERMTAWQRRVLHQEDPAPGFEVVG